MAIRYDLTKFNHKHDAIISKATPFPAEIALNLSGSVRATSGANQAKATLITSYSWETVAIDLTLEELVTLRVAMQEAEVLLKQLKLTNHLKGK